MLKPLPHWAPCLHSAAHLQQKSVETRRAIQTDAAKCSKRICFQSGIEHETHVNEPLHARPPPRS